MRTHCCKFLTVFLMGAAFLMPQVTFAENDVREAVRMALAQHPSIAGAMAGYESAQEDVGVAKSDYYPQISVSTAMGRVYQDNATSRGLVTDRGAAYSGYGEGNIALRQTLYDGAERKHRVEAARARAQAQEISLADIRETVALRAAQAYVDVLRAREALVLLREQREKIGDFEARIIRMAEDGAADETEVQQARDVSMIVDGVILDYQGQLEMAMASYAEAIGDYPKDVMPAPPLVTSLLPQEADDAVRIGLEGHPALVSLGYEVRAAQEDISVAKSGYLPKVGGELSYAKVDKKDIIGGESEDRRALLRMNWEFATGGRQKSEVDQMHHRAAQAQFRQDELRRQIERDIRMACARLQTFEEKSKITTDRVALNEKLYATYEVQFEGARINLLGLMRGQSQLFNAKLEESDNRFYRLSAQFEVMAAMGILTDTLLGKGSLGDAQNSAPPDEGGL